MSLRGIWGGVKIRKRHGDVNIKRISNFVNGGTNINIKVVTSHVRI